MTIITPNKLVPYLGGSKTFNPPVCADYFTFMNDAQTPLWDSANKQWRVFALVNTNATYPKKTLNSNTFIGGNSGWGEWQSDADFSNRKWLGKRIEPESIPITGAIATGCVIPYKGKYYWYASTGDNISDVSLFISDTMEGTPVYQQVVLSGGGKDFRDFDAQIQPDGTLIATISLGETGIGFYSSPDGINWTYLSTWMPPDLPDSLFECARMRTINGLTFLFFGANGWKNTDTNPAGDPAPRTYYSCGRWDGKTWTSGNIESVDFGSGFYGAVPFENPETHEWFCISWLSQWSFCANANHPYVEGEMQVYRLTVSGAICNATVNFAPVWTDPDTQFRIPRENMNFTATGNFSPLQFGVVDRGWLVWRHWDKTLKNGVRICLGANGGEHNFSSDPSVVAYGYQPKGFIMTRTTDAQGRRGWNISTRGMGTPPEFDNKSYAATYFLPQPDGATDDEIWVWIDGGYCSVFAGDSRGTFNVATFTVNWLMGAIPWVESYGVQIDSDGNIISQDSYPSSCRWWSDNFAQALCQGGQSYWDNIGAYKDAAEPDIRSSDGDNNYTLRIKKMVIDRTAATPQAGKGLLIQRTMNEPKSFETAVSVPTMPPAAGYVGVDNAIATYTPDANNSRARVIAVSKEDGKQTTGDYADSHFARPFVVRPDDDDESKPSQTYFLLTSEQIYAMINAMLVQTLQPSGESSQNKGVVQFFWDAVNNKFVGKLRDGSMVSENVTNK